MHIYASFNTQRLFVFTHPLFTGSKEEKLLNKNRIPQNKRMKKRKIKPKIHSQESFNHQKKQLKTIDSMILKSQMKIITCVFVLLLLGFVNKFMFLLNNFYVFYAVTI